MKQLILILFSTIGILCCAQDEDSTIAFFQDYEEIVIDPNFKSKYRQSLYRIRRVYPLALHAAMVIDSLDNEISEENKKRKQKKIAKNTHQDLKDEFKYFVRELYTTDGIYLSKLIHRETGYTVKEIIEKYRGGTQASIYSGLAKFWDQDLDIKFDAYGEDYVTNRVIEDIEAGLVHFDPYVKEIDKEHYKNDREEYKKQLKAFRARKKAEKKTLKAKLKKQDEINTKKRLPKNR